MAQFTGTEHTDLNKVIVEGVEGVEAGYHAEILGLKKGMVNVENPVKATL